jgi:hypothetical protein
MPQASVVSSSTAVSRYPAPTPFTCTWKEGGSGAAWVHVASELDLVLTLTGVPSQILIGIGN